MSDLIPLLPGEKPKPSTRNIQKFGPKPQRPQVQVSPVPAPPPPTPPPGYEFVGPPPPPPGYFRPNGPGGTGPILPRPELVRVVDDNANDPRTFGLWHWTYMFDGPIAQLRNGDFVRNRTPLVDRFTLYLMSTLCRLAYVDVAGARAKVAGAIPTAAWQRRTVAGGGGATYDLWTFGSNAAPIVVIPGTVEITDWLSYLPPVVVTDNRLPTGVKMFAGVQRWANKYAADVIAQVGATAAAGTGVLFTGHSVGGALAQYLAGYFDRTYAANQPDSETGAARGAYSFGAPAWMVPDLLTDLTDYQRPHVRVHNWLDPIPYAVQSALATLSGRFNWGLIEAGLSTFGPNIPGHVDQFAPVVLDVPGNEKTKLIRKMAAALKLAYPSFPQGPNLLPHTIGVYCDSSETAVRVWGRFPTKAFDAIVAANRDLDSVGA